MTITTDNYESWFYRYSEGELTERERMEVEAFIAGHPELAGELKLYDPDLRLQAVPMVFADKESLMRHERKVVPLWRWAVAASVVGAMVVGTWLFAFNREAESPLVAQATVQQPQPAQPAATATPAPATTPAPAVAKPRTIQTPPPSASPKVLQPQTIVAEAASAAMPTELDNPDIDVVPSETPAESQPTVVIHHEIYAVATTDEDTVEESIAYYFEPESGIESLLSLGRGIGTQLRAKTLRARGSAKQLLASL